MRLYPQTYPGGSVPQSKAGSGSNAATAWDATIFRPLFVRSTMRTGHAPEPLLDFAAIEREARAAQAAWIGKMLKSYARALVRKLSAVSSVTAETTAMNNAKKKAG